MLLVGAVHGVALGVTFALGISVFASTVVAAVIVVSAWSISTRHASRTHADSVLELRIHPVGNVRVRTRTGTVEDYQLMDGGFIHPWLVILRLQSGAGATRRLFPSGWSVDSNLHRQLRVMMLLRPAPR